MGSSPAVPEKPPVVEEEEEFILQDSKKVSFGNVTAFKYIWIDPKIYNEENQKYYLQLKNKFDLDTFTSLKGAINECFSELGPSQKVKCICAASLDDDAFRFMQNDNRVDLIFLFCQNEQRANLLRSNFKKIIEACYQLEDLIKSLETKKSPQINNIPKQTILLTTADDTHLMNKYRLNFACLCPKNAQAQPSKVPKKVAKKDFVNLAKRLYPDKKEEIQKFEAEFNVKWKDTALEQYMIKNCIQSQSFIWDMIYRLPKLTTDPKTLGYLRLPFYYLHRAIISNYKQIEKKPQKFYLVVELNENEKKNLEDNLLNFLIFTSFVKGYTTEKAAKKKMKVLPNSYLLQVRLSKKPRDPELDFGFAIVKDATDQNVILNIYNFLRISEAGQLPREAVTLYGCLAEASEIRKDKQSRGKLDQQQRNLLRNYDYYEDLVNKVDSQANVLQMSGYFSESINVYQRKTDNLNKTKPGVKVTDKLHLSLAEAYKINQDYKNAQLQLSKITSTQIKNSAKIIQAEIYLKSQKIDQMKLIVKEIELILPQLKTNSPPQYFRAQNLCGVVKMKQQQFKEANKLYKNLIAQVKQYYDVRFEGIPLLHDILRNKAICDEKLENPEQAINVLGSARGWQSVCQGISPSLALTQTMIMHLHRSQGHMEQVKKSDDFLKLFKSAVSPKQIDYMNRSRLFADPNNSVEQLKKTLNTLEQSGINIDFKQTKGSQMKPPIDQSSVNVGFNVEKKAPVILDQSTVNVGFNNEKKLPVHLDQSGVNVGFDKIETKPQQLDQSAININVNKSNDKPLQRSKPDKYFQML